MRDFGGMTTDDLLKLVARILRENTYEARKTETDKILDYYYYVQEKYIQKNPDEDDAHFEKRQKVWFNIVFPIVDILARLYRKPVLRQVDVPWGEEAIKGVQRTLQTVDELTLLTGLVGVRPFWDERRKQMRYFVYTPDMIDVLVEPEDPTHPVLVALSWGVDDGERLRTITHVWTEDRFIKLVDGKKKEEDENPYGVIPLVFFRNKEALYHFWDIFPIGRGLVKANEVLNKALTELDWTVLLETHGQLVLKGAPQGYRPLVGPDTYLSVPADGDAKYINPNADIDKALAYVNSLIDMTLMTLRIPESTIRITSSTAKSGVAIIAEQTSLAEWHEKRAVQFQPYEEELIRLSLLVYAKHNGKTFPEDVGIRIDYPQPEKPLARDEILDWQFRFANYLATPIDFLRAKNPELSEEEAIEIFEKNKAWFKENMEAITPAEEALLKAKTQEIQGSQ